ncbi:unnamed protein product, partial [Ectocarpus sp. 6 AP-2014]
LVTADIVPPFRAPKRQTQPSHHTSDGGSALTEEEINKSLLRRTGGLPSVLLTWSRSTPSLGRGIDRCKDRVSVPTSVRLFPVMRHVTKSIGRYMSNVPDNNNTTAGLASPPLRFPTTPALTSFVGPAIRFSPALLINVLPRALAPPL